MAPLSDDPRWYQRAVFYEVLVRGFYDASVVSPVGGHGSHLIGDLAAANALIVVPPEVTSLAPGDTVQVLRLDEEF